MSTTLQQEKAAAGQVGKLMKLILAIKKFLAKELVLLVAIAIISVPIAAVLYYQLQKKAPEFASALIAAFNQSLYMIIYVLTVLGLYFSRIVFGALQNLVKSNSTAS